jgi:hypothetical protein
MNSVLTEIQYLPPVSYFSLIQGFDSLIVEKFEHYQKQSYRNRCYVNTAQGIESLTVPVNLIAAKTPMRDVRIDYTQKWVNNHWRTIQSAYGKAPFFEYYGHELEAVLHKRPDFLFDLNLSLLTMCLKWLKYNIQVQETTFYEKAAGKDVSDYRSVLNPKKADSCNSFFKSVEYSQVFGSKFVNNLSIIDLVFCEGPGASSIVRASALKMNK